MNLASRRTLVVMAEGNLNTQVSFTDRATLFWP